MSSAGALGGGAAGRGGGLEDGRGGGGGEEDGIGGDSGSFSEEPVS